MICSNVCSCGIVSASLQVSGSGGQGDPWVIESNAFGVVTSSTRPAGPFIGQSIFETDTKRYVTFDGTNWVIMGGAYPEVNCTSRDTDAALSVPHATVTDLALRNEVVDSDGFHTGTTAVFTVPAGLGGDYIFSGQINWSSDAAGYRLILANLGSNTTIPLEFPLYRGYVPAVLAGANVYHGFGADVRLEAGATVTFSAYQTSGNTLTVVSATATLRMVRHVPSLV